MLGTMAQRIAARSAIAEAAVADAAGLHLHWHPGSLERRYIGDLLPWSLIRDADPSEAPPEIRLSDGRTCFVSATSRDAIIQGCNANGVPLRRRPPIWSVLLEEFLDGGTAHTYEQRQVLSTAGITSLEAIGIQKRLRIRMLLTTLLTWEWAHYGQVDAIDAVSMLRARRMTWRKYRDFREWSDGIAERSGSGELLAVPPR
jgi:hypothetical protein